MKVNRGIISEASL